MGKIEDDPVYNQPKPKSDKKQSETVADDPTYNQPISSPDDRQRPNAVANDPTYNQPVPESSREDDADSRRDTNADGAAVSQRPRRRDGTGDVTEDPTYDQSSQGRKDDHNISRSQPTDKSHSKSAVSRLNQLNSQLTTTTTNPSKPRTRPRSRTRKSKPTDPESLLPKDYSDLTGHIATMHDIAQNPPPDHRGYTRQVSSGKLTARQRIATLLNPNTFREVGSVTGTTEWTTSPTNPILESVKSFTPSNNPQGFGQITCLRTGTEKVTRQVYLTADDFAIRGGHADGHNTLKTTYGEKMALRLKVPVVKLVDGSSGGGSVSTIATHGFSYIPYATVLKVAVEQMNMGIPNLGAVVGPAIGLGAARVVSTHFSVMAADVGSLFNAGPKVVEGATFEEGLTFQELGGPGVHCANGTIDNMARDEKGCYEQIRTVLGYLPDCGRFQAPPCLGEGWSGDDVNREDEGLRSVVPRKKNRMYNPYTIIESVVDKTSWFEIGRLWGRTGIVGLARLGGRPVAILSNNCEVNGGALDAGGSQKLLKMIKFADVFNLPIVQFVDVPGYAIGTVAERSGTMKWGVELGKAYYTSTTPILSILTRRAYGVAGGIMLDSRDPWMRVAWPSANWGSLPLDGGIEVGHRHELKTVREQAEEKEPGSGEGAFRKRYKELEQMYLRLMNPVRTANVFNVEEIIDPKDTRRICCRWAREMYGVVMQERLTDRATGKIVPVFS